MRKREYERWEKGYEVQDGLSTYNRGEIEKSGEKRSVMARKLWSE
ncbi:MAG: hypothetical protein ACLRP8_16020 [Roseburia intestinalis]